MSAASGNTGGVQNSGGRIGPVTASALYVAAVLGTGLLALPGLAAREGPAGLARRRRHRVSALRPARRHVRGDCCPAPGCRGRRDGGPRRARADRRAREGVLVPLRSRVRNPRGLDARRGVRGGVRRAAPRVRGRDRVRLSRGRARDRGPRIPSERRRADRAHRVAGRARRSRRRDAPCPSPIPRGSTRSFPTAGAGSGSP